MTGIFKGYLKSKGKAPIEPIKNGNLMSEPPDSGDYVGVLNKDIIQLDFDDEESANTILAIVGEYKLKCNVLKTSRGVHLYFKTDGYTKSQAVKIYNACGIPCDVGLGEKDRVVPLRITRPIKKEVNINGTISSYESSETIEREWLQIYNEVDVIPPYLRPFSKHNQGFRTTETRNQTLFEYILKLQMYGFSKEEMRATIKVINKFMLYEPLPDKELDVITRDESFSEELFFSKSQFLHHRFGDYMLANSHIVMIDTVPHIYTNEHLYSSDPSEFEKQMLMKIPSLKDAQRKEVYKYISLKANKQSEFANPRYIGVKNGVLDISDMSITDYNPTMVISNRINFDYVQDAYDETMDKVLDKIAVNDPQIRALLEEMIGYTLFRKNLMQSCFILTGEGSNGKSTLINAIKHLLGHKNYTSLELSELEDSFKPAEMYNKLANLGDDISAKYIQNSSIFKKVVTGESFVVQKKYGQPFEMRSYATQIFSANELPQVHDKSDGFSRRLVIVPFLAKFSKTDIDYDPFIEDKLLTDGAMEYLLKLAIEGLKRVVYNKAFTKTDVGEREKAEYIMYNDNTLEWLDNSPKIENESVNDVYMAYTVWCASSGTIPVKKLNLSKTIRKHCQLVGKPRSIDGKSIRIYMKDDQKTVDNE